MITLQENAKNVGDSAYWGNRGDWFIVLAEHRDSDCLIRSNFRVAKQTLEKISKKGVDIERFSHWAVGWVDYLIINPKASKLIKAAEEIKKQLEDYPILDEQDFSELETDEANEVWQNCYSPKERVKYIREHKSQFEFRDFLDLLNCVRGRYFAGYASELLN